MGRLAWFGLISTGLAAGVITSAFIQYEQFYPTSVYLSESSTSILAILNFGLFLTLLIGKGIQRLVFGDLRATEVEHLYERTWLAMTETLLAMTIFERKEFGSKFLWLFGALLFTKVFHWISTDRVNFMEQSPATQLRIHIKMWVFMLLLFMIDISWVAYSIKTVVGAGKASSMILFGFEYVLLASSIFVALVKYAFHLIDMRRDEPWENKSVLIFYLEMAHDFFKLVTYIFFLVLILTFFRLPIHILRDLFLTLRSFLVKVRDRIRYQQATRNMDEKYPNATPEELARLTDTACIICREEMVHNPSRRAYRPKVLPCGHIFHFMCLRSWLERQQSCPICRRAVLGAEANAAAARRRRAAVRMPPATQQRNDNNGNNNGNAPTNAPPVPFTGGGTATGQTPPTHPKHSTSSGSSTAARGGMTGFAAGSSPGAAAAGPSGHSDYWAPGTPPSFARGTTSSSNMRPEASTTTSRRSSHQTRTSHAASKPPQASNASGGSPSFRSNAPGASSPSFRIPLARESAAQGGPTSTTTRWGMPGTHVGQTSRSVQPPSGSYFMPLYHALPVPPGGTGNPPAGPGGTAAMASMLPLPPPPLPPIMPTMNELSDSQLKAFSDASTSREVLEERVRALQQIQTQISGSVVMLTQILHASAGKMATGSMSHAASTGLAAGTPISSASPLRPADSLSVSAASSAGDATEPTPVAPSSILPSASSSSSNTPMAETAADEPSEQDRAPSVESNASDE